MKNIFQTPLFIYSLLLSGLFVLANPKTTVVFYTTSKNRVIINDTSNVGLILPAGFHAVVFADGIGQSRHLVVTQKGGVYVKLSKPYKKKGIVYLEDLNGDGIADTSLAFGDFIGTGIGIKNGYLYASSDEEIFRYKLDTDEKVIDPSKPERIVTGLINRHQHETKSIALDNNGNIYVNIGAYSNSCQEQDRTKESPGRMPCPVLDSAGGIWMFRVDKKDQTYKDGVRYATGLRNVVGMEWNNKTNSLFVMQHGRDQLFQNWPAYFDKERGAELPSECMYELHNGVNCGWPYMYYDHTKGKKMLAPEYGGDGVKEGGQDAIDPSIAFPGHMAPNDLMFYTGKMFPQTYKDGAFIAFHGSWNRAPLPQKGYFVVFVPFKKGKPTGKWDIFADGFSGKEVVTSTRQAVHRPCGLAQGPDGALYVCDDSKGTIYKITYKN